MYVKSHKPDTTTPFTFRDNMTQIFQPDKNHYTSTSLWGLQIHKHQGKIMKIVAVVCRRKNRLQRKTNNVVIFHQMKEWSYMKTFPTQLSYLVCTSQCNWWFSLVFLHTIFLLQIRTVYIMAVVLIQTELTGFLYFFTPEWQQHSRVLATTI